MFKPIAPLQQVLDQLVTEQRITEAESAQIADTLAQATRDSKTPWYIRGLIGIGGWFAALFFIGSLMISEIIADDLRAVIAGLIFCAVAIGGKRLKITSIFIGQLTLALSLAGQLLFIIGLEAETNSIPLTILLTIILEGVLIALYPDKLHRFLSTLVICGALFWLFIDQEVAEVSHLLVILLAIGTVLAWQFEAYLTNTRLNELYRPLGYAFLLALFGFLLLSFINEVDIAWWWLSAGGLLGVLLYLEYLILSQHNLAWQSKIGLWLLAGTAILIIPASHTPGILAALIGLLLGYHRGNRLLLGLSTAFLALFIIGYYYNLDLTLLTKSFVLIGTGVIFLGLRYGIQVVEGKLEVGQVK